MTNETINHLRVFIPRMDQFTDNRFVTIVKCIRNITGIDLVDAKGIVDADDRWHNVPTKIKSQWQLDNQKEMLDKLFELGCKAWIWKGTAHEAHEATPTQDYMDTLGDLLESTTRKHLHPVKEVDMIVELKHYILMAINFKQYKMAKYLIDNLAQYEENT